MNPDEYERMHALEDWYWWFVARRDAALRFLRDHAPQADPMWVLDAGCGTGGLLDRLRDMPDVRPVGVDFAPEALAFCRSRGHAGIVRGDLTRLPFGDGEFHAVTALDVLEHVEDDRGAVREIARVLRPGGVLIASVPAYQFLWSEHDTALHHKRRYVAPDVARLLASGGLEVVKSTYLLTGLFPLAATMRLAAKARPGAKASAGLPPVPQWANRALVGFQAAELAMARRLNLPFGLSVVAVARRAARS